MDNIGLIVNRDKDKEFKYASILAESFSKRGIKVLAASDVSAGTGLRENGFDDDYVINNSDMLICMGGDGSFLRLARKVYDRNVPILGINLGSLGFLTEVDKNDIDNAAECIAAGNYVIEDRMVLEAVIKRGSKTIGRDIALNDAVINRGSFSRILRVKVLINNTFVDSFPGDGLIVSTPTGSTGYTLSVGGPIVEPDLDLMIVSPICPHALYSRSFITGSDRTVTAIIEENYSNDAMLTLDGQKGYRLKGGDEVHVRKADKRVRLLSVNRRSFFDIVRKKIYYRGEESKVNEV